VRRASASRSSSFGGRGSAAGAVGEFVGVFAVDPTSHDLASLAEVGGMGVFTGIIGGGVIVGVPSRKLPWNMNECTLKLVGPLIAGKENMAKRTRFS